MLIIDAMRRASSAQEVCYLLTSYVETLPFYDAVMHLPSGVTALPVRGQRDIAARLESLQAVQRYEYASLPDATARAIIDEANQLFCEALIRLQTLDTGDGANFAFERRSAARPAPVHAL
jgi:hypothetical protein